jgi:hypothetical protein
MMGTSVAIFRPAQHGEDNRFEEQQSKAGRDASNDQANTMKFSGISRAASETAMRPGPV